MSDDDPFGTGATPPPPPPPPPQPPAPGSVAGDQQGWGQSAAPASLLPVGALATGVTILLVVMAVLTLLSSLLGLAYAGAIDDFVADPNQATLTDVADAEDAQAGIAVISILFQIATAVVFIVWQQRSRRNAEAMGATGQRFSPGLAAGCWFIPAANLVMPKIVLNDLWRATEPSEAATYAVAGKPVSGLVNGWWALYLIGGALGAVFAFQEAGDTLESLESFASTVRVSSALSLVAIVAAILAIRMVRSITARQIERASLLGRPAP